MPHWSLNAQAPRNKGIQPMPSHMLLHNIRGCGLKTKLKQYKQRKRPPDEQEREIHVDEMRLQRDLESIDSARLVDTNLDSDSDVIMPRLSDTEAETDTEDRERRQSHGKASTSQSGWRATRSREIQFPLPSMSSDMHENASSPGFFWDLAQREGFLKEVCHENRKHNGVLLGDWLQQAKNWKLLLWIFRDLIHLADNSATWIAISQLARLKQTCEVPFEEISSTDGYSRLEIAVLKKFNKLFPSKQADVMWSVAVLTGPRLSGIQRDVDDAFIDRLTKKLHISDEESWSMRELSLISWSLAIMGIRKLAKLKEIAKAVVQNGAKRCSVIDICSIAWAFKTFRFSQFKGETDLKPIKDDLCKTLAEGAKWRLKAFTPARLLDLVSSLGGLQHHDEGLVKAALQDLKGSTSDYSARHLVSFLVAYLNMTQVTGRCNPDLKVLKAVEEALINKCMENPKHMRTDLIANTCFALSSFRYYSTDLLQRLADLCTDRIHEITTAEMTNIAWGFARLGFSPGQDFLGCLNQHIMTHKSDYVGQLASNILWALAVLQGTDQPSFEVLVSQMTETEGSGRADEAQYAQLHAALALWEIDMREQGRSVTRKLISENVRKLLDEQQKKLASVVTVSNFQREVSHTLGQLGLNFQLEHKIGQGRMSVDIAFAAFDPESQETRSFAIEVDGPQHFCRNTNQPLGPTLVRNRQLKHAGFTVLSIPSFEFYNVPEKKRKEYLASKLAEVGFTVDARYLEEHAQIPESHNGQLRKPARPIPGPTPQKRSFGAEGNQKTFLRSKSFQAEVGGRSTQISTVSPARRKESLQPRSSPD